MCCIIERYEAELTRLDSTLLSARSIYNYIAKVSNQPRRSDASCMHGVRAVVLELLQDFETSAL